ncbi:heterokaryon incompatibility protein-domain-containing protein [Poronia punctata]|nr:heterokaryon incompatibility protein-domain-containing protein [Poronia punctata]
MSLCVPCIRVFRGRPLTPGTYYDHHPSWASFVAAADKRCDICWRRFDALDTRQQTCLRKFAEMLGDNGSGMAASAAGVAIGASGYLKIEFTYNLAVEAMNQRAKGLIDFQMQRELDAVSDFLLTRCQKLHFLPSDVGKDLVKPVIGVNTGSPTTWDLVGSWLVECSSSHRLCAERRGDASFNPTRLLDVLIGGRQSDTFKIVDGGDVPPESSYLTLSHRWGAASMPRLTVDNMASYRAGAAICKLPKTFQEAIFIAWRLGVRYIWIDSLCIIQEGDDGEDWMREAPKMAEIYSNCLLNISADWGAKDQGLFFSREIGFSEKFEMEFCLSQNTDQKKKRKRTPENNTIKTGYTFIPAHSLEQVDDSPLAGRGWVFQERILSPSIVHFGRREVLWECCQKLASESLPFGLQNISLGDMARLSQSATLKRLDPNGDPHLRKLLVQAFRGATLTDATVRDTPYLLWWFLISKYCRCALTFSSDRLVAVSGVARYFKNIVKDQYVLGMWRKYLAVEMAWQVKSATGGNLPGSKIYPGPSFSWTSIEGAIEPMNPIYDASLLPYVEVDPVTVEENTLLREDLFGPLTEPCVRIRVKGDLKSAKLVRSSRGQWLVVREASDKGSRAWLDFVPSEEDEFSRKTFFYMLWYTHDFGNGHCFMLFDKVDDDTAEFRRMGIFRPAGFGAREIAEWFLREQPDKHLLPGYDASTGHHTIYII